MKLYVKELAWWIQQVIIHLQRKTTEILCLGVSKLLDDLKTYNGNSLTYTQGMVHDDLIFILTTSQGGYLHHPNFTNEEMEAKGRILSSLKGSDREKIWRNQNWIYCHLEMSEESGGNKVEWKYVDAEAALSPSSCVT